MAKSLDNLKTLGMALAERYESIVAYAPPESSGGHFPGSVAEKRLLRLTKKLLPLASKIQKAYPVELIKWYSLAKELGRITEQIQDTHREEWEEMVTLLEEITKAEVPVQMAQMQSAHARALERMEKKYNATLRTLQNKIDQMEIPSKENSVSDDEETP